MDKVFTILNSFLVMADSLLTGLVIGEIMLRRIAGDSVFSRRRHRDRRSYSDRAIYGDRRNYE